MSIRAYAATAPKGELKPFEYEPGPLGDEQVEIAVSHCGICHSDLSMLDNDWVTQYPLVPGHEVVGTVAATGNREDRRLRPRWPGLPRVALPAVHEGRSQHAPPRSRPLSGAARRFRQSCGPVKSGPRRRRRPWTRRRPAHVLRRHHGVQPIRAV
ncbi:MAG: alcohol dehydrogenase catalytic domain-containing protein [Gemmataceae bacterium]